MAALAIYEGFTLVQAVEHIRHGVALLRQAEAELGTSPSDWTSARLETASAEQRQGADEINKGEGRLQSDPLLRVSRHLPYLADQARTILDLGAAAEAGARAEGDLISVGRVYNSRSADGQADPGVTVLTVVTAAQPLLRDADDQLTPATDRLNRDSAANLLPILRQELNATLPEARKLAGSVHAAAEAAQFLPMVLGAQGPKTYLILLPNPSEIRPSGGFTGEVGSITLENGKVTSLLIQDEVDVSHGYKDSFPPQGQLGTYLAFLNNQTEIGDAGWDPDFPTSAHQQEAMYTSGTGRHVDGTISIDPYVVAALLKVAGPITIPGYGSFDSSNVYLQTNVLTNVDVNVGKKVLPLLGQAVFAKVFAQPPSKWPDILSVLADGAAHRHLQVASDDKKLATFLKQQQLDGSLVSPPLTEDYLMVAEANVSATKADYYIKRSMSVKVEIYPSGLNRHQVDIHYDYPPTTGAIDTGLNTSGLNSTSRYRDYVRFYLPLTTTNASFGYLVDGKPAPSMGGGQQEQGQEAGHQVYGTFFILPRGHSADLVIYYEVGLPADPPYQLYIQKQAGLEGLPTDLTVSYPGGVASRSTPLTADETLLIPW